MKARLPHPLIKTIKQSEQRAFLRLPGATERRRRKRGRKPALTKLLLWEEGRRIEEKDEGEEEEGDERKDAGKGK